MEIYLNPQIVAGKKWKRISKSNSQLMSSADLEKFKAMDISDDKEEEKEKNTTDTNETTVTIE
jgi:hypothetical protein